MADVQGAQPPVEPEVPPADPITSDTPDLADDSADVALACGDDEDPEQHIGDEIADPWDDEFQTDWPQNEVTA